MTCFIIDVETFGPTFRILWLLLPQHW